MAATGSSPTTPTPLPPPGADGPRGPMPDADWPVQATDSIVRLVDSVRDKTTGPAVSVARVLVFGMAIALLALPLMLAVLVGSMRAVEHFIWYVWPGWEEPMWLVYLLFGTAFLAVGLVLWRRAASPVAGPDEGIVN